jgi:hypothetical protein
MKHLKRFNESITSEELQDFCESSLAYLMDEDFNVTIRGGDDPRARATTGQFGIFLAKNNGREFFKWDDVKDYYIPFLQLLSNRYDIGTFFDGDVDSREPSVRFRYRQKNDYSFVNVSKNFSYGRVINDDVFDSEGYWKDHIYYKWTPDPDLISIGVIIKVKKNQIKLDI